MISKTFVRCEDSATVIRFDGSDKMIHELTTKFSDNFNVRYMPESQTLVLIADDGNTCTKVYPWQWVAIDSCGKVSAYDDDLFGLVFKTTDDEFEPEALAIVLCEACKIDDWDKTPGNRREVYRKAAKALLKDYHIVRK